MGSQRAGYNWTTNTHSCATPVFRSRISKLSKMWWLELITESANGCSQFCELGMCTGLSWAILLHSWAAALGHEVLFSWRLVWVWKAREGITHMPGVLLEMSESLGSAGSLCLPGSPRAFPWGTSHRMGGLLTWQLCSCGDQSGRCPRSKPRPGGCGGLIPTILGCGSSHRPAQIGGAGRTGCCASIEVPKKWQLSQHSPLLHKHRLGDWIKTQHKQTQAQGYQGWGEN